MSPKSVDIYRRTLGYLNDSINKPFKEATEDEIFKHLDKYKPRTRNFHIVLFREFYRFIFGLEDTDPLPNCIRKIKPRIIDINEVEYRKKVVTSEEYNLMLENCSNPLHKALLEAHWCFGSRKNALQSLLVGSVSFDGTFTRVIITEDKTDPREIAYKGRCEHLLKWRESLCPTRNNSDAPLFVVHKNNETEGKKSYEVDGEIYEQIKEDYAYDVFARVTKKAGLKHITSHDFRHTCATRLLKEGIPTTHVCSQLGWKKNTAMLKVYDHNNTKDYEDWLLQNSQTNVKPTYQLLEKQKEELESKHGKELQSLNERLKLSEETQRRTEENITQIIESLQVYQPELSELVRKKAVGAAQTVLKNAEKH